ncbi:MAG TPA: alpha/beta hydrolase [Pyrinomonadaceae bacterium]|jgi:hypothetical protein|nr:alpha/beta hydrolase [Pyrinomonadaceae bacterium]
MRSLHACAAALLLSLLSCAALAQTAAPAKSTAEPAVLETPTGKLHGTLELPQGKGPFPVALVIAGSGPVDRNGNTPVIPGANNSLKYLAEGLAARGVASLRFDKRGVAESVMGAKSESDLRFDTYIEDAVAWGRRLRADKRFGTLTVVGHSEGSLIGMVAAQRLGADGFVSIAGVGRPAQQTLLEQLKAGLPPDLYARSEEIVKGLVEGKTTADVPEPLATLFRPSVQPYLISWFKYDAAAEVAKLDVPVLLVQGTHDIQVGVEEAKLLARAKPAARLLLLEGVNHTLKEAPAERAKQGPAYSDPSLPVVPKLLEELSAFVKSLKRSKS